MRPSGRAGRRPAFLTPRATRLGPVDANPQFSAYAGEPAKDPAPPRGLGTEGRKTWRSLAAKYEFAPAELVLLAEYCKTIDLLARLRAEQETAPLTHESKVHGRVASPMLAAIRDTQHCLRRLHETLGFPDGEEQPGPPRWSPPGGPRDRRSHRRAG